MKKIGLFYAPEQGSTEQVALLVRSEFGSDNVDMILVTENTTAKEVTAYDYLVMGISTVGRDVWDADYTKVGWDYLLPKLSYADFSAKTVALFGLGNHIVYADYFVDALGLLGKTLRKRGANIVGRCPKDEYEYLSSFAVMGGEFIGLPVDQDNDAENTPRRVKKWVERIKPFFLL